MMKQSHSGKILMLAPQPYFRARGTPFSVLHRVRVLCELGYQIDMVTYPFGENINFEGMNIIRSSNWGIIKDVKIGPSIKKIFLDISLYLHAVRLLKKNDYDVLHSHEEAAFFSVYLAKRFKLKHVYDMHSSLPQQLSNFNAFNLNFLKKIFKYLEDIVIKSCDAIITICPDLAVLVEGYKLDTPHLLIENTADDGKVFSANKTNIREKHNLVDKKIILYTGTFEAYQGIDILLQAFKTVLHHEPNVFLILVGGNKEQVLFYRKQANDLNINEAILFSGTVHPSEIPSYIKASDLIVSPRSTGTNTPLKIYGYLRSGKPIVATNLLTHTQVLNDNVAILVKPNAEGISNGLLSVLRDPNYASSKAQAAQNLADLEYSDELYTKRVHKIYSALKLN